MLSDMQLSCQEQQWRRHLKGLSLKGRFGVISEVNRWRSWMDRQSQNAVWSRGDGSALPRNSVVKSDVSNSFQTNFNKKTVKAFFTKTSTQTRPKGDAPECVVRVTWCVCPICGWLMLVCWREVWGCWLMFGVEAGCRWCWLVGDWSAGVSDTRRERVCGSAEFEWLRQQKTTLAYDLQT